MANQPVNPQRVEHPAGAPATPDTARANSDGSRSAGGSNYGDFAPDPAAMPGGRDPSRGAALERDNMPPDADFSRRPDHAGSTADPADGQTGEAQRPAATDRR